MVDAKFQVIGPPPEPFPGAFRGRLSETTRAYHIDEINNFKLQFYLADKMEYRSFSMLGMGLYATRRWESAENCFRYALRALKAAERNEPRSASDTGRELASDSGENNIQKALLNLFIGDCHINRAKLTMRDFGQAISSYNRAIKLAEQVPKGEREDTEYREGVRSQAYSSRAMAYRERNAFNAASADFRCAGDVGLETFDRDKVDANDVRDILKRADDYYDEGKFHHAEAEYGFAIEILKKDPLMTEQGVLPLMTEQEVLQLRAEREEVLRQYACALSRRGETYRRLGEYEKAKNDLEEANKMFNRLPVIRSYAELSDLSEDRSKLEQLDHYAHHCRILGEAHLSDGKYDEANKAHARGKEVYERLRESYAKRKDKDSERKCLECRNEIAGQLDRLGDVHFERARPRDTNGDWDRDKLGKARKKYVEAVEKRKEIVDPNCKEGEYFRHHLAHSQASAGRTHIMLNAGEKGDEMKDANESLSLAVCNYREARELEEKKDEEFLKRLRDEGQDDLRDDLAWSLTLHADALIRQGEALDTAEEELVEAKDLHEALKLDGKKEHEDHRPWILFTLAAAQYKQVSSSEDPNKQEAEESLLEGCKELKCMTEEKKKTWSSDYIDDSITMLLKCENVNEGIKEDMGKVQRWLNSPTSSEGKLALRQMIKRCEEERSKKLLGPGAKEAAHPPS
jgi:tetratricopeptide (TPR) repeat protein